MLHEMIADELMRMMAEDQAMRDRSVKNHDAWDNRVDESNAARLKQIVDEIGWPTVSRVGSDASHAAWLLAQHADKNIDLQREALRLMCEAPEGDVRKQEIAYLTDRVLVNEGRPQRFGTQFFNDENGTLVPRPIEDEDRLGDLRQAFELDTFAQNVERMKKYQKGQT